MANQIQLKEGQEKQEDHRHNYEIVDDKYWTGGA
jgi:hypothetical protein